MREEPPGEWETPGRAVEDGIALRGALGQPPRLIAGAGGKLGGKGKSAAFGAESRSTISPSIFGLVDEDGPGFGCQGGRLLSSSERLNWKRPVGAPELEPASSNPRRAFCWAKRDLGFGAGSVAGSSTAGTSGPLAGRGTRPERFDEPMEGGGARVTDTAGRCDESKKSSKLSESYRSARPARIDSRGICSRQSVSQNAEDLGERGSQADRGVRWSVTRRNVAFLRPSSLGRLARDFFSTASRALEPRLDGVMALESIAQRKDQT